MEGITPGRLHPAYVAGIIDGEGCVSIYSARLPAHRRTTYQMQVAVVMREHALLERLRNQYGGNLRRDRRGHPRHAPVTRWRISGNAAVALLDEIMPYLCVKRTQAMIAIHFRQHTSIALRHDPTAILIQEDCYRAIRHENRTGVER